MEQHRSGNSASHRHKEPDDSDIDLLVVLDSEDMPESFQDNMKNKLLVRKAIWELRRTFLLIYWCIRNRVYRKFQELGSTNNHAVFITERILNFGKNANEDICATLASELRTGYRMTGNQ